MVYNRYDHQTNSSPNLLSSCVSIQFEPLSFQKTLNHWRMHSSQFRYFIKHRKKSLSLFLWFLQYRKSGQNEWPTGQKLKNPTVSSQWMGHTKGCGSCYWRKKKHGCLFSAAEHCFFLTCLLFIQTVTFKHKSGAYYSTIALFLSFWV